MYRLVTVFELDIVDIVENNIVASQIHTVQIDIPLHSQPVRPTVQSRIVHLKTQRLKYLVFLIHDLLSRIFIQSRLRKVRST